ncbi:hypothetical protein ACFODZ_09835 [Marinicella sediminis]|uniref:Uncharacterized protein n=1 Tax=Marinicella sediminis TaxID=1792834 RepID=A0ABV7J8T6_9GAMM|nr:hypothetical protein [Marinicella sediminis]
MNKRIPIMTALMLAWSHPSTAVQLNPNGLGEVLIFPYYTVNNGLNTLYSVVNTTDQPKAIKISFHEADVGLDVLTYQVYLSSYDVWSAALVPYVSSIPGHVNEPSAIHVSADTSCAPFLNKAGQEFLPYVIDEDLNPANRSLARAREGYFLAIEMATLTGDAAGFVDHGPIGVPANCAAIQNTWNVGEWLLDPWAAPGGGLTGSAFLVNVGEGLSLSYDALALQNFWAQAGDLTEPGLLTPDLNSGSTESRVLLSDGTLAISEWANGYEAVSAVLMKAELVNEYSRDAIIDGKTDWVVSFPTKSFHVNQVGEAVAPFGTIWDGAQSCDVYQAMLYDRAEMAFVNNSCCLDPPPPRPAVPEFCYSGNVIELLLPGEQPGPTTPVLQSDNLSLVLGYDDFRKTENGWGKLSFYGEGMLMTPLSGVGFRGLPATGFAVQQFTNGSAAQGLLAQYGNLFKHQGQVVVTEEL